MTDIKQVIVVRKDLNMRKGKIAAQVAHASLAVLLNLGDINQPDGTADTFFIAKIPYEMEMWLSDKFTKVVVSVDSEKELLNVFAQAKASGLLCSLIKDAGLTEFDGVPTYTTVAIGPNKAEDINKITGRLKLL